MSRRVRLFSLFSLKIKKILKSYNAIEFFVFSWSVQSRHFDSDTDNGTWSPPRPPFPAIPTRRCPRGLAWRVVGAAAVSG